MKRESGWNPEQPPLLYLTRRKRDSHWGESPEKGAFTRREACGRHKSGELPRFRQVNTIGWEECNRSLPDGSFEVRSFALGRA